MNTKPTNMIHKLLMINYLAVCTAAFFCCSPAWSEPVSVDSLLKKMTLDEKIGQMVQVDSAAITNVEDIKTYFIGSILSGGGSDPKDNMPATWQMSVRGFEEQALKTRMAIPLIYGIDAVHGHNNIDGAVIFPHNIGIGAAHDAALARKAAKVTAEEIAGTGIHWAFAPCIAVARNPRWGRTYESFGEATDLVSELGAAEVSGMQEPLKDGFSVAACAKHFVADGGTLNGTNEGNAIFDEARLRKVFLPPYQAAIAAGARTIMVSFNSWNGVRMHANKHLMTDVLKGELGFKGFLVSDWAAIDQITPDYKKDIEISINAGLDMAMIPNGPGTANNYVDFIRDIKQLVAEGRVSESRIDDAARRILQAKVDSGIFEHPFGLPELMTGIGSKEHREVARACVRESLVLLKNEHHALPLALDIKKLTVVGAAADDLGIQCGGWSISWQGDKGNITSGGTTLLAAIKKNVSSKTIVTFSPDGKNISHADCILVVVGETPYAETKGDRSELSLSKADAALVAAAKATGSPVVTILYSGRPLVLGDALKQSDAFVAAWLPGTEGLGLTDVLFGDTAPTGKLPRIWPANVLHPSSDDAAKPLYQAGYGLAYGGNATQSATASHETQ